MFTFQAIIWCFSVILTAGLIALLSAGHDVYLQDEDERC